MIQEVKEVNMIDRILNEISALSPKEIREIFMRMWRHIDALNYGLTADDCVELFATALKGSSDLTYDLLKDICHDYSVGTITETFALLPRETYDKMFSECLKGKIPTETRLDTEALIELLMLENVSEIEASIRKGCIRATHFIGSDKKYIYDTGIDDEEIQWEIEDFKAIYPHTWWTVEQVIYND